LFGPAEDAPVAVCDARSVAPGDLVFRDRRGELRHRLFGEVLLLEMS